MDWDEKSLVVIRLGLAWLLFCAGLGILGVTVRFLGFFQFIF